MMNDFEDELDAIRIALYEENKHLSDEDFVKRINERGRAIAEQFGFTVISNANNAKPQQKKTAM